MILSLILFLILSLVRSLNRPQAIVSIEPQIDWDPNFECQKIETLQSDRPPDRWSHADRQGSRVVERRSPPDRPSSAR